MLQCDHPKYVLGLSVFLDETQNQIDNATLEGIATLAPPFGIILDGFARQIQIWNTCALSIHVLQEPLVRAGLGMRTGINRV